MFGHYNFRLPMCEGMANLPRDKGLRLHLHRSEAERCTRACPAFRAASLSSRYMRRAEGPPPLYPHPCARHRDPARPSPWAERTLPAPRTRRCWISVTRTEMRMRRDCSSPKSFLQRRRVLSDTQRSLQHFDFLHVFVLKSRSI